MDPEIQSKIIFFFEQFWSFMAVSIAVALGGLAAKRVAAVFVPPQKPLLSDGRNGPYRSAMKNASAGDIAVAQELPLAYRLWRATISTHPVIVGGLIGLTPIPVATWVPDEMAAHVLWFALAGAVSGQVYEICKRIAEIIPALVRKKLGMPERKDSNPPSDPPPKSDPPPEPIADSLEPSDGDDDHS